MSLISQVSQNDTKPFPERLDLDLRKRLRAYNVKTELKGGLITFKPLCSKIIEVRLNQGPYWVIGILSRRQYKVLGEAVGDEWPRESYNRRLISQMEVGS